MVKYLLQHKLILALTLTILLVALLITACNLIDLGGSETPTAPATSVILAPAPGINGQNTKVLLRAPVQIQSTHSGDNVTRLELSVREPNAQTDKLLRSDVPSNGTALQQWTPEQVGVHTIRVRAYDANNAPVSEVVRTIEVIPDTAISLGPVVTAAELAGASGAAQPTVIPLTPIPIPISGDAAFAAPAGVVIQVVATSTPAPTATPIPRYPPPPPIPGVPPGPVQLPPSMYQESAGAAQPIPGQDPAQSPPYNVGPLLNLGPPVCDAAEYLGPFISTNQRRIIIPQPDDIAAPVVGGTTVFRAWRLQNVGTCTWGPGYELAFYGGRSMGSGGVAFESTFPGEPARRNALIDANRLIVPAGKPNQVAVVEVQLLAPVTPGIHQSYWRMRNPHGVFFGPIVGVTMQVVRTPTFGVFGAPVIIRFVILGVGNVYNPTNPVNVRAELGDNVILEWEIINATNFDIVFVDPTGNIQTVSTQDQSGRFAFPATRLGRHTITLYADNGAATVQAQVNIDVVPRAGEQFELDILLGSGAAAASSAGNAEHVKISSSLPAAQIAAEWQYPHENVARFILQILKLTGERQCTSDTTQCNDQDWWQWPFLRDLCKSLFCSPDEGTVINTIPIAASGNPTEVSTATINTSIESLCAKAYPDPNGQSIQFRMLATDNQGYAAQPSQSNIVTIPCPTRLFPVEIAPGSIPVEIRTPTSLPVVTPNP